MRCYCVVNHGEPIQLTEKEIPELTEDQVLVKVGAAGLCHTDLHLWDGYYDLGGGKKLLLADRGIKPPLVLSHEICGTVVSVGSSVDTCFVGKKYLIHPWIGCGKCKACLRGEENICTNGQAIGVVKPGGFAEYVVVPNAKYLVDIEGLTEAEAAPLACAGVTTYSAIKKFGKRIMEDPIVIIGAGGLGLMAIQIINALGGVGAIAVDIDPDKRNAAIEAGALSAIDANADDATKQIMEVTSGGARSVLDLVGSQSTLSLAIACSARGNHIVVCGLMGGEITIPTPVIAMRPLNIEGSYVGTLEELKELVDIVRRTNMKSIPVNARPMSEINIAMQELHDRKTIGRTVLIP